MEKIKEVIDQYASNYDAICNLSDDDATDYKAFVEIYVTLCRAYGALQVTPEKQIFLTVADLRLARMEEIEKGFELGEKQAKVKRQEGNIAGRQTYLISVAYADGIIDGKNAEIRKSQENQIIAADETLIKMEKEASDARTETTLYIRAEEEAKVQRRYLEDLLSAQRAVLIYAGKILEEGE